MNGSPLDRPLRLAVYFDQSLHVGGGGQQAINAALLARQIPGAICETLFFTNVKKHVKVLKAYGIDAEVIEIGCFERGKTKLRKLIGRTSDIYGGRFARLLLGPNKLESVLKSSRVDLVYFLSPTASAQYLETLNFIATVWDLCHRDDPEFPEVRQDWTYESREQLYGGTLGKAVAVIAESELGKLNIVRRYAVDEDKVHVIPFSPAPATVDGAALERSLIDVKLQYSLQCEYVFYPAQFWAHKNHVYILEALYFLERDLGRKVGAIFAGGDIGGNLEYLMQVAKELGVQDRVRFVGFVTNEMIPHLYRQSLALVMPTYFGPSNLPPLEAFTLGVPVIYPNKRGLREQVGDAALLVDLEKPTTLAGALFSLLEDAELRANLIAKGWQTAKEMSAQDTLAVLVECLKRFRVKRKCWR